jgi:hypothetical protein
VEAVAVDTLALLVVGLVAEVVLQNLVLEEMLVDIHLAKVIMVVLEEMVDHGLVAVEEALVLLDKMLRVMEVLAVRELLQVLQVLLL